MRTCFITNAIVAVTGILVQQHAKRPQAGHGSRSDRMIHRRRTHVALDRILGLLAAATLAIIEIVIG